MHNEPTAAPSTAHAMKVTCLKSGVMRVAKKATTKLTRAVHSTPAAYIGASIKGKMEESNNSEAQALCIPIPKNTNGMAANLRYMVAHAKSMVVICTPLVACSIQRAWKCLPFSYPLFPTINLSETTLHVQQAHFVLKRGNKGLGRSL